ncbi:hypothetical protein WN51_06769 [Melipona quadrifasciata]|uniref:Uncharacterized protein n=1 Tax=Melipona quadrifasciata TaxID=166423 RepID=A0A0M8ZQR0_9HYME|nr:hypothetical protein WN51_06769 [Melipona quadrifasciata]
MFHLSEWLDFCTPSRCLRKEVERKEREQGDRKEKKKRETYERAIVRPVCQD